MAQSWATTWHPVVGSWFMQNIMVSTGVEPSTYSMLRTGRTGLTTQATVGAYNVYGIKFI
jgi:hypothetical protein